MPPPLAPLEAVVLLPDDALRRTVATAEGDRDVQLVLYDVLRREQAAAAAGRPGAREAERILDLAAAAFGELVAVVIGRSDALLDSARDGDWTMRDVLRHAIAVELRYREQVRWAATRAEDEPIATPDSRLPCDRVTPPATFDETRTAGIRRVIELFGTARDATDAALSSVGDDVLERPSMWGPYRMDVRMRLHQIAAHITETTVQIEKMLVNEPATEARRIVRRCAWARGLHERWSDERTLGALDARYAALGDASAAWRQVRASAS